MSLMRWEPFRDADGFFSAAGGVGSSAGFCVTARTGSSPSAAGPPAVLPCLTA